MLLSTARDRFSAASLRYRNRAKITVLNVWTEALSGIVFVLVQKLSGIEGTYIALIMRVCILENLLEPCFHSKLLSLPIALFKSVLLLSSIVNYWLCQTGVECQPRGKKPWARLFEGRLTLNLGLNLTRVSFSCAQKHFLGSFLRYY